MGIIKKWHLLPRYLKKNTVAEVFFETCSIRRVCLALFFSFFFLELHPLDKPSSPKKYLDEHLKQYVLMCFGVSHIENLTRLVISYEIYETRRRLVS